MLAYPPKLSILLAATSYSMLLLRWWSGPLQAGAETVSDCLFLRSHRTLQTKPGACLSCPAPDNQQGNRHWGSLGRSPQTRLQEWPARCQQPLLQLREQMQPGSGWYRPGHTTKYTYKYILILELAAQSDSFPECYHQNTPGSPGPVYRNIREVYYKWLWSSPGRIRWHSRYRNLFWCLLDCGECTEERNITGANYTPNIIWRLLAWTLVFAFSEREP